MAKQKLGFKIRVKEIGNGFLVSYENMHGIGGEELFCGGETEVILQIEVFVKALFKEKDKK